MGRFVKGIIPYNKLHPEIMPRGKNHHTFGKKFSKEHRQKLSFAHMGKVSSKVHQRKLNHLAKNGFKICYMCEKKLPIFQFHKNLRKEDGLHQWCKECCYKWFVKNKEKRNIRRREQRHKLGISKQYITKYGGKRKSLKYCRQRYKALFKKGGALTIQTIQQIYENNIKKYETLTCIYCLKPIQFGKDTLEHKIPLSRDGKNNYENLAIACRSCNSKKHNKTEKEYIDFQKRRKIYYGIL